MPAGWKLHRHPECPQSAESTAAAIDCARHRWAGNRLPRSVNRRIPGPHIQDDPTTSPPPQKPLPPLRRRSNPDHVHPSSNPAPVSFPSAPDRSKHLHSYGLPLLHLFFRRQQPQRHPDYRAGIHSQLLHQGSQNPVIVNSRPDCDCPGRPGRLHVMQSYACHAVHVNCGKSGKALLAVGLWL